MPKLTIRVSEEEVARDARRAYAALERAYREWREAPPENKAERAVQLDRWIIVLGESQSRMRRAEAAAMAARRKR